MVNGLWTELLAAACWQRANEYRLQTTHLSEYGFSEYAISNGVPQDTVTSGVRIRHAYGPRISDPPLIGLMNLPSYYVLLTIALLLTTP